MIWAGGASLMGVMALLGPASSPPPSKAGRISAAYTACAEQTVAKHGNVRAFDCTAKFYGTLPGNAGSTSEMNAAFVKAIDAGNAFVDRLLPRIEKALLRQQEVFARVRFRKMIKQRRDVSEVFCRFQYDLAGQGSIRGIYYGGCKIQEIDRLVGDMIGLVQPQVKI